ncbi:hypothetical protein ACIBQ1_42115 [Nonomuraea sp. NPDC050153]|uniref:hypothetical protein n=1 Tax=Nonomuraea sp. NPDC050153 TaxID=3364359 RepID=UPI003791F458
MSSRRLLTLLALATLAAMPAGCGSGTALSRAAMDQARRQGVAPDLMYVVDLPGFELAEQSVGAVNEEGFGAFYTAPDGRRVEMRIDRGPYRCAGTCERDGGGAPIQPTGPGG